MVTNHIGGSTLNGETFFEMVDHYYRMGVELGLLAFRTGGRARSSEAGGRGRPDVLQTLDRYSSPGSPQRWRYAYVRQLLDAALLYYQDRLGAQEWDAFAKLAGRFAMVPRARRYAVRRETIDDHARGEDHLFQRIRAARSARDVLAYRVERPELYGEGEGRANSADRDVVAQLWDLTEREAE